PLGAGFATAAALAPGRVWTERRSLPVYAGAPAGEYRVEASLYLEAGPGPLGTAEVGRVAVRPSERFWPGQVPGFRALDGPSADGWSLLGWSGSERVATGERAYVTTVWRVGEAGAEQALRLSGADGLVASTGTAGLSGPAGSVLRLQVAPPI